MLTLKINMIFNSIQDLYCNEIFTLAYITHNAVELPNDSVAKGIHLYLESDGAA